MAGNLQKIIPALFTGSNGGLKTPEELAQERKMAQALMMRGADTSPVQHWTQGAARLADALSGVVRERRVNAASDKMFEADNSLINQGLSIFSGGGSSPATSFSAATPSQSTAMGGSTAPWRDAIASIESAGSGDYSAIGPTNAKLGRALGRYQIMEANLPTWGQEALGRPVSAQEFLANPQIQDAIFDNKFGGYVKDYGLEGAAQAWFAGPGGVGKLNRKDVLGTDVGSYGSKFMRALGRSNPLPAGTAPSSLASPAPDTMAPVSDEQALAFASPVSSERIIPAPSVAPAIPSVTPQPQAAPMPSNLSRMGMDAREGDMLNGQTLMRDFATGEDQLVPIGAPQGRPSVAQALLGGTAPVAPVASAPLSAPAAQATPSVAQALLGGGGQNYGSAAPVSQTATVSGGGQSAQRVIAGLLTSRNPQANKVGLALLQQQSEANAPVKPIEINGKLVDPRTYQVLADFSEGPKPQPLVNSGDGRIYDPNNDRWIVAPGNDQPKFRQATPQEAGQYGAQGGQFGPDGRFYPINPPSGTSLQVDPATGAVSFNQGAGVKPLTEGQSKDTVYATRAEGALPTLDKFGEALTSPAQRAAEYDPTGLVRGQQSPEFQQAKQAGDEFLQAILRKDTGAAITKEEMSEYGRVYIPMPGDGPELLAQKRISRARALEAMKAGMPPQAILQQEQALKRSDPGKASGSSKPIAEMTDEELEALANGNS